MGEAQELPAAITGNDQKAEEINTTENANQNPQNPLLQSLRQYKWWLQLVIYTVFNLAGQSLGVILGRLYYTNGGNSNWMATFVQCAGFPIILPFLCIPKHKDPNPEINQTKPSTLILASIYICLGIFLAADCLLYSVGLKYLPVSTYSLIGASQLGFNALFSYFLNKQKFTPYILNSLVLLTISSVLLVFQNDDSEDPSKATKSKYILGFICTLAASAGWALMLSLTQLAFQKIIKRETMSAVIDMSLYQNVVASFVILIGLFASGEWKKLNSEMEHFKNGKVLYVMNLVGTAVAWQIFTVGCTGLIFKISSLFSNMISMLSTPVAPVLAVIFLHEKMTGLKGISMVLALWGFLSYMYQQYLDDLKMKNEGKPSDDASEVPLALTG